MIIFLSECYANYGFTRKLIEELRRHKDEIRVNKNIHKRVLGRERILKEIERIYSMIRSRTAKIIAVIDFEEGYSRKFIGENFVLQKVSSFNIYIGVYKRLNNVYAIIFDPHIEEAFICKFDKNACRDPSESERYKSEEAIDLVMKLFRKSEARKCLDVIAGLLVQNMKLE